MKAKSVKSIIRRGGYSRIAEKMEGFEFENPVNEITVSQNAPCSIKEDGTYPAKEGWDEILEEDIPLIGGKDISVNLWIKTATLGGRRRNWVKVDKYSKRKCEEVLLWANSFTRFDAFLDMLIAGVIPENHVEGLFVFAYTDSDNMYNHLAFVKSILRYRIKHPEKMMNEEELEVFRNLPEKVTVHRGMTVEEFDSKQFGVSWTLSKEKAEFFAFKYWRNIATREKPKMVHTIEVPREKIIAFLNGRKEEEVLILLN